MTDTQNEFKPLDELSLKFGDMLVSTAGSTHVYVGDGRAFSQRYKEVIKPSTTLFRRVTPQAPEPEQLTLRDQVAIAAMQRFAADGPSVAARSAFEYADTFLAERNRGKK